MKDYDTSTRYPKLSYEAENVSSSWVNEYKS